MDRRLLIIDDSLSHKIAEQLKKRGKNALAIKQIGLYGVDDVPLLRALAQEHPGAVLVTGDDHMPSDHWDTVRRTSATIAIVLPKMGTGYEKDQWQYDVIHKWAHVMEVQEPGTIRRYAQNGGRAWSLRKRPTRQPRTGHR